MHEIGFRHVLAFLIRRPRPGRQARNLEVSALPIAPDQVRNKSRQFQSSFMERNRTNLPRHKPRKEFPSLAASRLAGRGEPGDGHHLRHAILRARRRAIPGNPIPLIGTSLTGDARNIPSLCAPDEKTNPAPSGTSLKHRASRSRLLIINQIYRACNEFGVKAPAPREAKRLPARALHAGKHAAAPFPLHPAHGAPNNRPNRAPEQDNQ